MMMRQQCAICRRDGHLLADIEMESKDIMMWGGIRYSRDVIKHKSYIGGVVCIPMVQGQFM